MTIYQFTLDGGHEPPDIVEAIKDILERFPESRDDYRQLMYLVWMEHYGLGNAIPVEHHESFERWFLKAPSPKTIQNRALEIQKRYRPDLDASPEIRAQRERQAKQGIVR